jgi:hypothetical protein
VLEERRFLPLTRSLHNFRTLQELLASENAGSVEFFNKEWNSVGSKLDHVNTISSCTGISKDILLGTVPISECSVAERMSWAAGRDTTRPEDAAYCLLGIFNVNMALLYGEGTKSLRRLQEEIVKHNNDLTILAWENLHEIDTLPIRLFADTPAAFSNSSRIESFNDTFVDFSVTNNGLFISGAPLRVVSATAKDGSKIDRYALFVGVSSEHTDDPDGGIYLRKLGPKLFMRDLTLPLAGFGDHVLDVHDLLDDPTG